MPSESTITVRNLSTLFGAIAIASTAACMSAPPDDVTRTASLDRARGLVRGTRDVDYMLNGQISPRPGNDTGLGLAAVFDRGSDGSSDWQVSPAMIGQGGAFTLPDVCADTFYLEAVTTSFLTGATVPTYIATSAQALDLSYVQLGRTDVVQPAPTTQLALSLTGLAPWDPANDDLQLTSAGAGLGFSSLPSVLVNPPAAGATTVSSTLAYPSITPGTGAGLIDARRGDRAYLAELSDQPVAGDLFYSIAVTRAAELSDVVMSNGGTTPISAGLTPVPPQTFASSVDRDAFAALANAVAPSSQYIQSDIHVDVLPVGGDQLFTGGFADLAVAALDISPGRFPLSLAYGDPYPASWPRIWNDFNFYQSNLSVPAPGGAVTYTNYGVVALWEPLSASPQAMAPRLGPVQSPTIAGFDFASGASGVGESPTLSWTAPAVGTASYYDVQITVLDVSGGAVNPTELAELETVDTSLTIPPGIFTPGSAYQITITAIASADTNIATHPFTSAFVSRAQADALSGLITP
jgi:hypothetical protein